MTKRYFYTCPHKVIYMCKYFKMRFLGDAGQIIGIDTREDNVDYMGETFKPRSPAYQGQYYYLHPDCHAMLEPQEGDLCRFSDVEFYPYFGEYKNQIEEIIQRNGKAFFMPECEEV